MTAQAKKYCVQGDGDLAVFYDPDQEGTPSAIAIELYRFNSAVAKIAFEGHEPQFFYFSLFGRRLNGDGTITAMTRAMVETNGRSVMSSSFSTIPASIIRERFVDLDENGIALLDQLLKDIDNELNTAASGIKVVTTRGRKDPEVDRFDVVVDDPFELT